MNEAARAWISPFMQPVAAKPGGGYAIGKIWILNPNLAPTKVTVSLHAHWSDVAMPAEPLTGEDSIQPLRGDFWYLDYPYPGWVQVQSDLPVFAIGFCPVRYEEPSYVEMTFFRAEVPSVGEFVRVPIEQVKDAFVDQARFHARAEQSQHSPAALSERVAALSEFRTLRQGRVTDVSTAKDAS